MDPKELGVKGVAAGDVSRREFVHGTVAGAAVMALGDIKALTFPLPQQDAVFARWPCSTTPR